MWYSRRLVLIDGIRLFQLLAWWWGMCRSDIKVVALWSAWKNRTCFRDHRMFCILLVLAGSREQTMITRPRALTVSKY